MSGGKVRTLQDRSAVGGISGFALSSDRFSFFSERLSFFYKKLVAALGDESNSYMYEHTMHEGNEICFRFTAETMLLDQRQ